MFYCPKCANSAVPGQRHCRHCGIKLDLIQDAIEGKQRGPLDFETLKRDLKELGSNLRTGFEEAGMKIKQTRKLSQTPQVPVYQTVQAPNWSREFEKALRKVKAAHTRKYSLQQATLSILSGSAYMAVWYYLLNIAADSGLFRSIELIILQETGYPIDGLLQLLRLLWVLGIIPVTRGVAHLINAVFFAPKKIEESVEEIKTAPSYVYPSPVPAQEPQSEATARSQSSVTEEETLRFEPR
ncbi:MAG: zinc ribbon domain-containing protein [Acidobacteria bacterium]|nr:zinc ribbon domain-containing protein [Acidobacteriota bacterium]